MVVARVFGGLGNQMFIYAAARCLAIRNGVPLSLDVRSGFVRDAYRRSYQLSRFNIMAQEANAWDSFSGPLGLLRRKALRAINRNILATRPNYIREAASFEESLLSLKVSGKTYLEGYWQDERYFEPCAEQLRRDFTLVEPVSAETGEIARQMQDCDSVSLHARRYDSVSDPRLALAAPSLAADYYLAAMDETAATLDKPHFFCFSDQPEWFRNNMKTRYPMTFVTHNQQRCNDHEDLWLMGQCAHHIIANSTFSWWGAWLGSNPAKMIIAPQMTLRPPRGGTAATLPGVGR
jgi:hypothetical protein